MATEIIPCAHGHVINGQIPTVDQTKFEVQYPDLIGKVCDCGKLKYFEEKCNTCTGDKWKIVWKENV